MAHPVRLCVPLARSLLWVEVPNTSLHTEQLLNGAEKGSQSDCCTVQTSTCTQSVTDCCASADLHLHSHELLYNAEHAALKLRTPTCWYTACLCARLTTKIAELICDKGLTIHRHLALQTKEEAACPHAHLQVHRHTQAHLHTHTIMHTYCMHLEALEVHTHTKYMHQRAGLEQRHAHTSRVLLNVLLIFILLFTTVLRVLLLRIAGAHKLVHQVLVCVVCVCFYLLTFLIMLIG